MLQSKPVRRSESENVQEGIADIKERIRLIQDRANLLSGLFASLCREVTDCSKPRLVSQIHNLTHQIQLFFLECQHQQCGPMDYSHFPGYARNSPSQRSLQLQEIKHEQERLLYLCDSIKLSARKDTQKVPLIKLITLIGSTFSRVVELMLGVQIKTCVESLREAGAEEMQGEVFAMLREAGAGAPEAPELQGRARGASGLLRGLLEELGTAPWHEPPALRRLRQLAQEALQELQALRGLRTAPAPGPGPARVAAAMPDQVSRGKYDNLRVEDALEMLLEKRGPKWQGGLVGIIHAAGVQEMTPISAHSPGRFEFIFAPKSQAAWNLHTFSAMM